MTHPVYTSVFQFKKGTAARWEKVNPILLAGEPGFVIDENRMKVGDGITAWNDLPYIGENSVVNAATHYDFPSIGRTNAIYKAESEKKLYQWDEAGLKYDVIGEVEISGDLADVEIIHGGNAVFE